MIEEILTGWREDDRAHLAELLTRLGLELASEAVEHESRRDRKGGGGGER